MARSQAAAAALAALCALLALAPAAAAAADVQVTDAELAAALEQTRAAAGQPRLFYENLPTSRPLERAAGRNWYSYDYSVFTNYDADTPTFLGLQSVERGNLASGVLNLTLEWKPLPGVTAEMMEWVFGNLHRSAVSPFDGHEYPMYTILHPVDHITFLAKPADTPVGKGSTFTFMETPNSRCTYQPGSFRAPYACAADRAGFTRPAAGESEWRRYPQTNATLVVDKLDRTGCTWYRARTLPHFGERAIIASKLWWEDTPAGLVLRASRLAGVMAPGKVDEFDAQAEPELLQQANEVVRVGYLDGGFNNNVTQSAYAFALHWGQEWTGLKDWLPQVFADARREQDGPVGEPAAEREEEDRRRRFVF